MSLSLASVLWIDAPMSRRDFVIRIDEPIAATCSGLNELSGLSMAVGSMYLAQTGVQRSSAEAY